MPPEPDTTPLDAGGFAAWIGEMRGALRGEHDASVPCSGCTACCTASQFVTIEPDESDTLAHIPRELLFPAPRRPRGHMVLGYDERGHCAMLVDGACSIYEHRPRACRTYDCRVLVAAEIDLDDETKAAVAARVRRWRFRYEDDDTRVEHDAIRAAAGFLRAHRDELPDGAVPLHDTQVAVLALDLHELFLADGRVIEPAVDVVATALARHAPQEPPSPRRRSRA